MNLLQKVSQKLQNKTEKVAKPDVNNLNKLPDQEKIKVLEYLSIVKNLHKETNGQ